MTIKYSKMTKLWPFYEVLKFETSFKMHICEGGQNGEDEMVLIDLKGGFMIEEVFLDIIYLRIVEIPSPLFLDFFFCSFQSLGVLKGFLRRILIFLWRRIENLYLYLWMNAIIKNLAIG